MGESLLHKQIKEKAMRWISQRDYAVARMEVLDGHYGIIDAWGISRSELYTIGVEVKISRMDYHAAKKKDERLKKMISEGETLRWSGTNEFYYAVPEGLVSPEEVVDGMGLLWHGSNGYFYVKKHPYFLKVGVQQKLKILVGIHDAFLTCQDFRKGSVIVG